MLHDRGKFHAIRNPEEITNYNWHDIPEWGITRADLEEVWRTHMLISTNTPPAQGSDETLRLMKDAMKKLSIITARDPHLHRSDVIRWLDIYFPGIRFDWHHFANHLWNAPKSKWEICRESDITLLIDDAPSNVIAATRVGVSVILIDKAWNRGYPHNDNPLVYRAKDWWEIRKSLIRRK
jgi:uncharacterized HAD superfamily protein